MIQSIRPAALGALCLALSAAPSLAAAPARHAAVSRSGPAKATAEAVAMVTATLDKFNKGDSAAFFAAHTADSMIVDEFAPYRWTGTHAAESWAADYERDARARGITDGRVDYGQPIRATVAGSHAYVVLPTTYRFRQHGKPMREDGQMTFALAHLGEGWKIAEWTWAGPPPTPAGGK